MKNGRDAWIIAAVALGFAVYAARLAWLLQERLSGRGSAIQPRYQRT